MKIKFSPARHRALEELVGNGGEARISNRTDVGAVYWQSANWLVDHGLARLVTLDRIEVTDLGRQAWQEAQ